MTTGRCQIIVRSREQQQLTLDALALHAGVHPALIERLVEFGLITPSEREGAQVFFDPSAVSRLQAIIRIRKTLGVNLAGVSVILDLVDRLCAVQRENKKLQSRL
jgi:DNA-binding transcriptional MerR regulator